MFTGLPVTGEDNLIPFDEVVARAKKRGVNFGKGNPLNRLRYYTKIGLLPHAKRKSFAGGTPSGAYPESVVDTLVEIDEQLQAGRSVQVILREKEEKAASPLEQLPPHVTITPIPQVKPPPPSPRVQVPVLSKGPPYEPLIPEEPIAVKTLKHLKPTHYVAGFLVTIILGLPLLYFFSTSFRDVSKDIVDNLKVLNPIVVEQQTGELALPPYVGEVLGTVSDPFLTINVETDVNAPLNAKAGVKTHGANVDAATGKVYASNILYGIQPGVNVAVSTGQTPTISVPDVVTGAVVRDVLGTVNKIVSSGGANPALDIASTYPGQTSINTLGQVSTGEWRATRVGAQYGGTGQTTYTAGDILYATGATSLTKLGVGAPTQVLTVSGGGLPSWQVAPGGEWTAGANATYLTNTAADLAIGGTNEVDAAFGVNVASNTVYIGDGTLAANTIVTFKADTGGSLDTGNLIYNTSDQFQFSGGDVLVDQDLRITSEIIIGSDTIGDFVGTGLAMSGTDLTTTLGLDV
ncbi:MAG TPA: hypothetical protein VF303_00595, partial [Candidatus Nanoarchaeia archaeon]